MRIVTCVGYHGTGSGAVADYLSEFNIINNPCYGNGEFEFRLLFDPDGIRDLEYHLVEEKLRGNQSAAIKRFIKFVKFLNKNYSRRFNIDFLKISLEYVDKLTSFSYEGWSLPDYYTFSSIKQRKMYIYKLLAFFFNRKKWKNRSNINPYKKEISYHSNITRADFLKVTKDYLNNLFSKVFVDDKINLLEQMTPTNNLEQYLCYFDDLKVFVVDRDPRDCYIQYMIKKEHIYPIDVHKFCKMYKDYRKNCFEESNCILKIQFEDLIYKYDETTTKICKFLDLNDDNHTFKKIFDPSKSIKNTKLFLKHPEFNKQIKIIENELFEYLYNF